MYQLALPDRAAGSCHQDLLMHNTTIRAAASLLASCAILTSTITAAQAAPLTATPGTDDSFLRTAPTVPVHQGQYGPDTTLTQARKAAGVTTGKPWPYDTTLNLEIPDASAYRAIPEIRTPGCTLTKEHPNPVVLVHGTWANAQKWNVLAPYLQKHGYCVFAMNYGFDARSSLYNNPKDGKFATNNIYSSAIELNNYVNQVLKLTGAKKVDLVGHSQAGLVFHLWMHDFRGNLRTQHSITLAGTNHGTTMMGFSTFPVWDNPALATSLSAVLSSAAMQQLVGSPMVRYINSLPDTMPGVRYTALATKYDTTSTPYYATFLKPVRGATVTNVTVENVCKPGEMLDHNKLTTNQAVQVLVLRALQDKKVTCSDTQWAL